MKYFCVFKKLRLIIVYSSILALLPGAASGIKIQLMQLKAGLSNLHDKLADLNRKLVVLPIILVNDELIKRGKLDEDCKNIIPFYCDMYEIDPGDGQKRKWSKFISDLNDGGNFNAIDLFDQHSYIRWIFPVFFKGWSGTEHLDYAGEIVRVFKKYPILLDRLIESFQTFVGGYYKLNIVIVKNDSTRANDTVTISIDESLFPTTKMHMSEGRFDHNLKRIKRVLHSLMAFGLKNYAEAFFDCLDKIAQRSDSIGAGNKYFPEYKKQVQKFNNYFDKNGKYIGPEEG